MKWFASELHTHTLHSDGRQTLEELAAGAAGLGFDAIALTDHNTMSGLIGRAEIGQKYGVHIIPGMEWTTFYGHMVTIGLEAFADWRDVNRHNINKGIAAVHQHGGIAGIAHPFRIGSPACTGCYWEYELNDWNQVDYIEVWSGTFPSILRSNHRAFELWTQKLNEGYRITATSGRDWHTQEPTDDPISVTYLGIEEIDETRQSESPLEGHSGMNTYAEGEAWIGSVDEKDLINSLRKGRAAVTMGPLLTLTISSDEITYSLGAVIPAQQSRSQPIDAKLLAHVAVDFTVRAGKWSMPEQTLTLKLCSNLGEEQQVKIEWHPNQQRINFSMPLKIGTAAESCRRWIRAECWGTIRGAYVQIAFTNAIYFEEGARQT
ncbi:CehA/McbA family metallohydrolase [Paenibacillus silvae]|uniref:CehA/McbA family metallohydrolase n=1 Tax=Paenibacillus silvae TaxID=1325358 RepID=UPI0020033CFE|nr:CehA/McbA family metallohydrolase [Paenibacillus silvae]MCK6073333.1 CehA/McbA family metallohydrolase [Paenibacillus silvae]MCK6149191.1 CehA/McbA family metallohydrolase [Paenibacillus silvae]MCK6267490.1 CehA/McbA family metallohydrolase [Paenibacillus silvae]